AHVAFLVQLRLKELDTLTQVDDLATMLDTVSGTCMRLSDIALSLVGRGRPVTLPASPFLERASVPLLEPIQVLENVPRHIRSILERFPDGSELARGELGVVAVVRGHLCLLERVACVPSAELPSLYTSATGRARTGVRDSAKTIPDTPTATTPLPELGEPADDNSPADQPCHRS